MKTVPCIASLLLIACGGQLELPSAADGDTTHSDGAASDGGSGVDGWSQCASPSGLEVCGGPTRCADDKKCEYCFTDSGGAQAEVNVCLNAAFTLGEVCFACVDGNVCVVFNAHLQTLFCQSFDLGVLFAQNGAADRVLYADFSQWTGGPLPDPGSCAAGTCGGSCPPCGAGDVCTGRSPLHPAGICVPPFPPQCHAGSDCAQGSGCFQFSVQPAAQALADANGYCLAAANCTALASSLPGGGKCALP